MITDEMVEAVARAMCDTWGYVWDGDPDDEQTAPETCIDVTPGKVLYREAARAALEAVLPMIRAAALEGAAMVADRFDKHHITSALTLAHGASFPAVASSMAMDRTARQIATAIRAMKGTSHE